MKRAVILVFFFLLMHNINAQISSDNPITTEAYQKMLGTGLDVDWSKTKKGRDGYSIQAVKDFYQMRFSHVRIRVKDDVSQKLLDDLRGQVDDCIALGIIPIIAYQAAEFKEDPTETNLKKVVKWWKVVSTYFRNHSHLLSYDIMIECSDALNKRQDMVNLLFEEVVSVIRETNPSRIVFISPRVRSEPENLKELKIPTCHNGYLMAEFHFYASGPSKTNKRKLWTTGTPQERKIINDKINTALEWQKSSGILTWVGAWMPGNYNDENNYSIKEQVAFSKFVVDALHNAGIPFAVNQGDKFYDYSKNEWIEAMMPIVEVLVKR